MIALGCTRRVRHGHRRPASCRHDDGPEQRAGRPDSAACVVILAIALVFANAISIGARYLVPGGMRLGTAAAPTVTGIVPCAHPARPDGGQYSPGGGGDHERIMVASSAGWSVAPRMSTARRQQIVTPLDARICCRAPSSIRR